MAENSESSLDLLWKEYGIIFQEFDDLTLARWLAQTLGQLEGKAWRLSHPLLGAYRLAAQVGHERQIWFKRMATPPAAYSESHCCRAPMLVLLTRDVRDTGLLCQHCNDTLVPYDEISPPVREEINAWALLYAPVHAVAHWDDRQRKSSGNYDRGQLGSDLVVAQGTERPANVGAPQQPVDQEKDDHEGEHQVVGRDLFPKEGVDAGIDRSTCVAASQAAKAEQQGVKGQRKNEGDNACKNDS
jgi:hypothetical protein